MKHNQAGLRRLRFHMIKTVCTIYKRYFYLEPITRSFRNGDSR